MHLYELTDVSHFLPLLQISRGNVCLLTKVDNVNFYLISKWVLKAFVESWQISVEEASTWTSCYPWLVDDSFVFVFNYGLKTLTLVTSHIFWWMFSSPAMPLNCYHGACYLEKLDVLRDRGRQTTGVKFHLSLEGFYWFDNVNNWGRRIVKNECLCLSATELKIWLNVCSKLRLLASVIIFHWERTQ